MRYGARRPDINTLTRYFTTKTMEQSHCLKIILASTSPYRKEMLSRLPLAFDTAAPNVDETPLPGESPLALAARLALAKAAAVSDAHPEALVIGSDQVAECAGAAVGKPGSADAAQAQLRRFSGRTVLYHSAFALLCRANGFRFEENVVTEVRFRELSDAAIARYVALDRPLDCAGSIRTEAAGPTLFEYMRSDDPSAIMGLPLIALAKGLRRAGFELP
jgi:septum formation protein